MLKSNVAIGLVLEIWIMNVAILDTLVWIDTQVHMVCVVVFYVCFVF